jgi:hypothetical protein
MLDYATEVTTGQLRKSNDNQNYVLGILVKAPSANQALFAAATLAARARLGSMSSRPCTGVKAREEANPEVAVPEVDIEAILPFADFDNLAVGRRNYTISI